MSRKKIDTKFALLPHRVAEGDLILIKYHTAGPFDPVYVGDY